MKEATGDIWDLAVERGGTIVITTNGTLTKNGGGVMGRGIAQEAAMKVPGLRKDLGDSLRFGGNHVAYLRRWRGISLISFPVKWNWWEQADIDLIRRSAQELEVMDMWLVEPVWVPRPGCGNGRLDWKDVKPVIEPYLDNRFVVVTK